MTPSITLSNLSTGYKGTVVTPSINASLHAGELTCLLGPNGAGKSTLLRTLSAFIPPLSGSITAQGTDIRSLSPRMLARTIGVVLTERPSATNMTVQDLIAIGRSPYTGFLGSLRNADKRVVEQAIALVGIDDLRYRSIHTLSDGERQKAMIAKALAQQTPIIFLDEPTAFLDYPSKVDIMKLLYRIAKQERKTVFMSTHDLELALQVADKVWLLDKPHGLRIGVPEDLALRGDLAAYFQSDGLRFDNYTGTFHIIHPTTSQVTLTGDGPLADMARKALNRNGIATTISPTQLIINIRNNTILVNDTPVNSIEQMMDHTQIIFK